MTAKYYALLTNLGAAKLANATALGTQLSLTQMAVGDGGGILPTPDPAQTKLIGEKRRASLNSLTVDPANTNQIIAEQIIPEDQGGFWIREIGLFDQDNTLIAIANCPETYKPQLQEGSGRTQTVRMILVVNSTDAVTLKIDPSVVLATRKYVDDKVIEVKAYADNVMANHVAAANPHPQYDLPVGIPLPWPTATPPAGWLKCNGAAFDKAKYPKLAAVYPLGLLPDLRGEFIRGWDDGRGVDAGRVIYGAQGATGIRTAALDYFGVDETTTGGTIGTPFVSADSAIAGQPAGAKTPSNATLAAIMADNSMTAVQLPANLSNPAGIWITMRPRNIAFNYIVRAA
ncbi:phage-related tail fiber protein [Rahnella sp. BIGb0603]|jgi:phage-related tail fiber protein|uniref:phage tail-collar fiber domain-containing protein n=1 Tax=Rahnella sp. BIGb0603 TaxID=2940612 RepID=UPI001265E4A7|nr:phage tail protein [Rahnella sp. BIGb0603]KAB8311532.1 phage tail protein [Rouxiella chamberiensis]MCS3425877.1 phage-related tail fiber protein [Rahnella sp. BIGb0603]